MISSPNYPQKYPSNGYQYWKFRAPRGYVVVILLQLIDTSDRDHLYFGDGVDKFSTSEVDCNVWRPLSEDDVNKNITSISSTVKLIFTSNAGYNSRSGFSLKLRAVKAVAVPRNTSGNLFIRNSSNVVISSDKSATLSTGSRGPVGSLITFNTTEELRIVITFQRYCMTEQDEIVEIGDGLSASENTMLARFSGRSVPSDVTSVSNSAWIAIRYPSEYKPLRLRLVITTVEYQYEMLSNESSVTKRSPNFPREYPSNAFNIWIIRAPTGYVIHVSVDLIELATEEDNIFLGDGVTYFSTISPKWRRLQSSSTDIMSKSSFIILIFTSDGQNGGSGFMLQCRAVKAKRVTNPAGTTVIKPSTVSSIRQAVQSPHLFKTIMIATFSATTVILVLVGVRWLHIKARRKQLNKFSDRKYYEVPRMLPELPPRNWIFQDGFEQRNGKDHVGMRVSMSSENIYEIVPDYELSDLESDSPKCNGKQAEEPSVTSSESVNADEGYARVPDPLVPPADTEHDYNYVGDVDPVDDYEVIDHGNSPQSIQPVSCARDESKVPIDSAQPGTNNGQRREKLTESRSLPTSVGNKSRVRVSADVHKTFSGSPVTVENILRQPKKVNNVVDITGYLKPMASQKSTGFIHTSTELQPACEDLEES